MANPQSGNVSLLQVGRDLMLETGNISLASTKYKDAAQKTNADISVRDFHKLAWGQGRTKVSTSGSTSASSVRPHHFDIRYDNVYSSDVTSGVTYDGNNGSPRWYAYWKGYRDIPTASYFCGYAKIDAPNGTAMRLSLDMSRTSGQPSGGSATVAVYGYANGYLSGASTQLLNYTSILTNGSSGVKSFTHNSSYPHLQIVVKGYCPAWNGVMGYDTYGNFGVYNFKVYQA